MQPHQPPRCIIFITIVTTCLTASPPNGHLDWTINKYEKIITDHWILVHISLRDTNKRVTPHFLPLPSCWLSQEEDHNLVMEKLGRSNCLWQARHTLTHLHTWWVFGKNVKYKRHENQILLISRMHLVLKRHIFKHAEVSQFP